MAPNTPNPNDRDTIPPTAKDIVVYYVMEPCYSNTVEVNSTSDYNRRPDPPVKGASGFKKFFTPKRHLR